MLSSSRLLICSCVWWCRDAGGSKDRVDIDVSCWVGSGQPLPPIGNVCAADRNSSTAPFARSLMVRSHSQDRGIGLHMAGRGQQGPPPALSPRAPQEHRSLVCACVRKRTKAQQGAWLGLTGGFTHVCTHVQTWSSRGGERHDVLAWLPACLRANRRRRERRKGKKARSENRARKRKPNTNLFAAPSESLDHLPIQPQRERCLGPAVWPCGRVSGSVWSH